ncbi:unnamed protein product [Rhizoctonia solani]|uniref:Uncharacterized protein n=1 Tax=Rhizoctonia solani TaxID=456999 RepID=A0A8H3H7C0_9AGAM|nr:unnamed protein product [Rhizoctonia solani]
MNNSNANPPPDLGRTAELIVYSTQRRLRINGVSDESARWQYHCPLVFGTEIDMNGVLSPVCYYDDKDISNMVTQNGSRTLNIIKPQGDPESVEDDYLFSINIQRETDNGGCFQGVLNDHEGEWDWRGRFSGRRTQARGVPGEEIYGPDGHSTLQELLSYPSMSVQGTNPAQEEASHILGRIIQASIPEDVRQILQLSIPFLDQEEEGIRQLAPDFLPRAAVVTMFKQWQKSEHVDSKQRNQIDTDRCDKFYPACAANSTPTSGPDPVEEFGWDRERDADVIQRVQGQYRKINLACYRLGYRRKVTRFQPFLAHPAYWYERLAEYLVSPTHRERFALRVLVHDPQVEPDIHDWYTQLALLREAAGDNVGNAPSIEDVTNTLKGVALLSSINEVQLDDSFITNLNELFTEIENLRVDSEEYIQLNKLLAKRQTLARSGARRAIMQSLQHYRSSFWRVPNFGEISKALCRDSSSMKCLGLPMQAVAPILVAVAMSTLINTLAAGDKQLSLKEKIAVCLSLAPIGAPAMTRVWDWAKCIGAYITEALPSRVGKVLSTAITKVTGAIRSRLSKSKLGMTLIFTLGVVVAGLCVWGAFERFQQARRDGKIIDKLAAGCDLMLSFLFSLVTVCEAGVALIYGANSVLACCGVLSGGIAASALISSLAFAVVKWYLHRDPIVPLISKYGDMYGLLKR